MKKLYIHPQTFSEICMPANSVLLISGGGGPSAEPGKTTAPARVNWGKNVQLDEIYFI